MDKKIKLNGKVYTAQAVRLEPQLLASLNLSTLLEKKPADGQPLMPLRPVGRFERSATPSEATKPISSSSPTAEPLPQKAAEGPGAQPVDVQAFRMTVAGAERQGFFYSHEDGGALFIDGLIFAFESYDAAKEALEAKVVKAPMPGKVTAVLTQKADKVDPGQALVIMEAMKMETKVEATIAGTVDEVAVAPGDIVAPGAVLIRLV